MSYNDIYIVFVFENTGGLNMPYFIFEGPDGVGKSTAINNTISNLKNTLGLKNITSTQLPGTTPLGQHIRKLVKDPQAIDQNIHLNPLTRQMLYAADYSSFIIDYLNPLLESNEIVICDRSSKIPRSGRVHHAGV